VVAIEKEKSGEHGQFTYLLEAHNRPLPNLSQLIGPQQQRRTEISAQPKRRDEIAARQLGVVRRPAFRVASRSRARR